MKSNQEAADLVRDILANNAQNLGRTVLRADAAQADVVPRISLEELLHSTDDVATDAQAS
jgi:hypothetical protein